VIPRALELCRTHGPEFDEMETSYFLSRQRIVPTIGSGMALRRGHSSR
jgi:KUP system potassium uptake protein